MRPPPHIIDTAPVLNPYAPHSSSGRHLHNETNLPQLHHTILRQHPRTLPTYQTFILGTSTFDPFVETIGFLLLCGRRSAFFYIGHGRGDIVVLILGTEFDEILKVLVPTD